MSKVNTKSNRIPTNFLRRRLHDTKKRRRFGRPTKQSTPSKKVLLSNVMEEDENLEGSLKKGEIKDMKKIEAHDDQGRVAKLIEAIVQEDGEEEKGIHGDVADDDNNKDGQRMIKHTYDDEGPGSPSFRIYFTNNNNVEDKKINEVIIGNKDVIKNRTPNADTNRPTTLIAANMPSTEVVTIGKKVKKESTRKNFKSALSKNLLKVRSCCSAAHSRPNRTHLLPGKAPVSSGTTFT